MVTRDLLPLANAFGLKSFPVLMPLRHESRTAREAIAARIIDTTALKIISGYARLQGGSTLISNRATCPSCWRNAGSFKLLSVRQQVDSVSSPCESENYSHESKIIPEISYMPAISK